MRREAEHLVLARAAFAQLLAASRCPVLSLDTLFEILQDRLFRRSRQTAKATTTVATASAQPSTQPINILITVRLRGDTAQCCVDFKRKQDQRSHTVHILYIYNNQPQRQPTVVTTMLLIRLKSEDREGTRNSGVFFLSCGMNEPQSAFSHSLSYSLTDSFPLFIPQKSLY